MSRELDSKWLPNTGLKTSCAPPQHWWQLVGTNSYWIKWDNSSRPQHSRILFSNLFWRKPVQDCAWSSPLKWLSFATTIFWAFCVIHTSLINRVLPVLEGPTTTPNRPNCSSSSSTSFGVALFPGPAMILYKFFGCERLIILRPRGILRGLGLVPFTSWL